MIASACEHNIRLVLTLTNYLADYGGMQIWVQWFKGKSISEFFTNPNITCALHLFHHLQQVLGWRIFHALTSTAFPEGLDTTAVIF